MNSFRDDDAAQVNMIYDAILMTRRLNRLKQPGKLFNQHKSNKIKMLTQELTNINANIKRCQK